MKNLQGRDNIAKKCQKKQKKQKRNINAHQVKKKANSGWLRAKRATK